MAAIVHTLTNPAAETGDMTGWTVEVGDIITTNGDSIGLVPYEGEYYFRGANYQDNQASQEIDLIADGVTATAIDSNSVFFKTTWQQSSYSGNDKGAILFRFKDSSKTEIYTTASELITVTSKIWTARELLAILPEGTRYVDIIMQSWRIAGTWTDGYFDVIEATSEVVTAAEVPIVNPGAEEGDASGWLNNVGGIDVRSASPTPFEGSYYFSGGNYASTSSYQRFTLADLGFSDAIVDTGELFIAGQWAQTSYSGADKGQFVIRFRNSVSSQISVLATELSAINSTRTWEELQIAGMIPVNTRYIDVELYMSRSSGTHLDSYFDAIRTTIGHFELFDISDLSLDISVELDNLVKEDLPLDLFLAAKSLTNISLDIQQYYQGLNDFNTDIAIEGNVTINFAFDLFTVLQTSSDFALDLAQIALIQSNLSLDISSASGTLLTDYLLDLALTTGLVFDNFTLDIICITKTQLFKAVYGIQLNSILEDITT